MRILHFSDTHLGYSEHHRIDPVSGLNQREQDFYHAWNQVIDYIKENPPDVIVHAGDLFHTPRPSNRAIHVALQGLHAINALDIPVILIAGNHETPRIRTTGSIFESLNLLPLVYAAFSQKYERFMIKGSAFHCLPHCSLSEELEQALSTIDPVREADYNILVTHGAWRGRSDYGMGEFNEQQLPDLESVTGFSFDYIALGHYHRFVPIRQTICYSGSTERTSLNEAGTACGFLTIDVEKKEPVFHPVSARPMIALKPLDCQNLSAGDIYAYLENIDKHPLTDALVQLKLINIQEQTFIKLDMHVLQDFFKNVFRLEKILVPLSKQSGFSSAAGTKIDALPLEFSRYMETESGNELDKNRILDLGARYLSEEQKLG